MSELKPLKPCPFCGGKMEFYRETYINKYGKEITEQYYMHDETDCILNDVGMPFVLGAGDATENYIGEYAEKWNRRADHTTQTGNGGLP